MGRRYAEAMFPCKVSSAFRILLTFLFFVGMAGAQNTMHLCGADIRIGMAKDRVLETTSTGCELKSFRTKGSEVWCARPTEGDHSKLAEYEGCHILQFENGTLININRHISEVSGEAVADIMNAIYEFTRDAKADGKSVTIATNQSEYEKSRYRTITFDIGDRSLVLNITQPVGSQDSVSSVSLIEVMARRSNQRPAKQ
jgi:hypothetical protein